MNDWKHSSEMTEAELSMDDIDATIDDSRFGIVDGIGVVEIVESKGHQTVVDTAYGVVVVKSSEVKPYDGR